MRATTSGFTVRLHHYLLNSECEESADFHGLSIGTTLSKSDICYIQFGIYDNVSCICLLMMLNLSDRL